MSDQKAQKRTILCNPRTDKEEEKLKQIKPPGFNYSYTDVYHLGLLFMNAFIENKVDFTSKDSEIEMSNETPFILMKRGYDYHANTLQNFKNGESPELGNVD